MMRKILILKIGLVFLLSTVNAEPLVMRTGCDVLAPDGNSFFWVIGQEVIKMNNKVTITCMGTMPADIPAPDKALIFDYSNTQIIYETDNGPTIDWKEEITPSGKYILKITVDIRTPI
jgi:hypothetical protein